MIQDLTPEQQALISTEPYSWIYALIGNGAADATPAEAILLFDRELTDRELRKCIETMRRAGIIIAASNKGYYFPSDYAELAKYVHTMEAAAKSTFYTLKSARKMLRELEEQAT